jgi:hypothetical protein
VLGRCQDVTEMIRKLLSEDLVPLNAWRPDLPAGLVSALMRGLARRPEDRFANVGAFRRALLAYR